MDDTPQPDAPDPADAPGAADTPDPADTPGAADTPAAPVDDEQLPQVDPSGAVQPVDLRDWVVFDTEQATRVRVFATASLTHDLWCLEPQQATSVLRYGSADVTYTVLGGRAWFVTEQGEAGLDPLASLLVPAGVTHGIDNRGPDPLIVLAAGAPPDDDEGAGAPLTRLAAAVRPRDTTGSIGQRLRGFLAGER